MIGGFTLASQVNSVSITTAQAVNLADFTAQAKLSGASGAVSAALKLQLSNDPLAGTSPASAAWEDFAFTLSGTGVGAGVSANSGYQNVLGVWQWARVSVTAISGTGAAIDVFLGGR